MLLVFVVVFLNVLLTDKLNIGLFQSLFIIIIILLLLLLLLLLV